jgi:L-threonylcarbamoyladenylate synthase
MDQTLQHDVEKAAKIIASGGVVAFPTETYYGLAVDPFNKEALVRLYQLKKRQRTKPLLVLIAQPGDLDLLVDTVPPVFEPFIELWPAPVTLVFPALSFLPLQLTGGTATIGVRISSHPVATALVRACGFPITATSANISGMTPCHQPDLIKKQFQDRLDYILDGGETPGGAGSTLIGIKNSKPVILRDGVFSVASLSRLLV